MPHTRSRNVFCFVRSNNGQLAYYIPPTSYKDWPSLHLLLTSRTTRRTFREAGTKRKKRGPQFPLFQISKLLVHHFTAMADVEAPHHYKFNIKMSCSGCSGAVDRVLKKTEGLFAASWRRAVLFRCASVSTVFVCR